MAHAADVVVVFETHATSLDNEAGLASGWFDVALSVTGEAQARELGARRRADDLAAVFCSDLIRAFRTAGIRRPDGARDRPSCDVLRAGTPPQTRSSTQRGEFELAVAAGVDVFLIP